MPRLPGSGYLPSPEKSAKVLIVRGKRDRFAPRVLRIGVVWKWPSFFPRWIGSVAGGGG